MCPGKRHAVTSQAHTTPIKRLKPPTPSARRTVFLIYVGNTVEARCCHSPSELTPRLPNTTRIGKDTRTATPKLAKGQPSRAALAMRRTPESSSAEKVRCVVSTKAHSLAQSPNRHGSFSGTNAFQPLTPAGLIHHANRVAIILAEFIGRYIISLERTKFF